MFDFIFPETELVILVEFPPLRVESLTRVTPVLSMLAIMLRASNMPEFGFKRIRA
jgi:hypothetical protein